MTRREFGIGMAAVGAGAAVGAVGRASGAEAVTIDLDVLVVGGGVQGLSVLLELERRGITSAFLLSREPLGGGETLHSHGYMMRGYALPKDAPLPVARGLAEAFAAWARFLADHGVRHAEGHPTYLGTADPSVVERWKALGLPFEPLSSPPEAFARGHYARGGHLFRTEERLFLGTDVVRALAGEVAGRAARGEVLGLRLDARRNRIDRCEARVGDRTILFRPSFVILAAGRDNQRLLRGVALGGSGREGTLADRLAEPHLVREVPMILVRGRDLPNVSGFFLDAKLSMATHPADDGERMWVATPLGGHATTRADVDGRREPGVDPALVKAGLERLAAVIPETRALLERGARVGAYVGAKVDHPSGALAPVVADVGVSNLRVVWPVVLTLAGPAAVEVVGQLERAEAWPAMARARRPLDERARKLAGAGAGSERRLARTQRWYSPDDLRELVGS